MSNMLTPSQIYHNGLIKCGLGIPLWHPEPLPKGARGGGEIRIGDVGILDDGRFVRLFNVMHKPDLELDDAIPGPPNNLELLRVDSRLRHIVQIDAGQFRGDTDTTRRRCAMIPRTVGPDSHASSNFTISREAPLQAHAILSLPGGAVRETYSHTHLFAAYMKKHQICWLQYAQSLGYDCRAKDLLLVTTSCWTVEAHQQEQTATDPQGDAAVPHTEARRSSANLGGPLHTSEPSQVYCVFVEACRLSRRRSGTSWSDSVDRVMAIRTGQPLSIGTLRSILGRSSWHHFFCLQAYMSTQATPLGSSSNHVGIAKQDGQQEGSFNNNGIIGFVETLTS